MPDPKDQYLQCMCVQITAEIQKAHGCTAPNEAMDFHIMLLPPNCPYERI